MIRNMETLDICDYYTVHRDFRVSCNFINTKAVEGVLRTPESMIVNT